MNQTDYNDAVTRRADEIIENVVARPRQTAWSLTACLSARAYNEETLTETVMQTLGEHTLGYPQTGGPFQVLPVMLLLRRWESRLPDRAIEAIRAFFTRGMIDRGNTENHWLMYYAGNLLAAERWRDEPVFWNGRPPSVMEAEATRWISGMIDRTALIGHHEYDSPGYHVEHMTPLIGLFEHTENDDLREKIYKVLSLLVADMALEYFHGSWAGGHSREGYRENTRTRVGPIRPLQYLFFGGEPFDPAFHVSGTFAMPAVAASYRPPALFADIAWDRERPHVVKKTKAPRNIYRHTDTPARPVRKYTYMSRSFAIGSSQVGLPGDAAGPIDLVSWDLTWRGEDQQAKVTCNHPFIGASRFSAFLPPLPQTAGRDVGGGKPYLQRPDRLFGASPFERVVQHEGTVILLYRIPEADACPFANVFLPRGIDWVERSGWLFGDVGDFHLALRPVGDYDWLDIRESRNDSVMVHDADLIDGWLLRIRGLTPGLVVEAVEADRVDSFEAYAAARSADDADLSGWPEGQTVSVATHDGHDLCIVFDGEHTVDGTPVTYETWPLYGSPNAEGEVGTGRVSFRHGDAKLEVDFELDPAAPLIPMRVIG